MSRFFGEDESVAQVDMVVDVLSDFVASFSQAKEKFLKKRKSKSSK